MKICVRKIGMRVGGVGISKKVELENLDAEFLLSSGFTRVAGFFHPGGLTHVIFAEDVHVYFGPQVGFGIFAAGVEKLLFGGGEAAGRIAESTGNPAV